MKNFSFLAVLSFMLLNACNSNDEFEYLPSEKAELVAAEYLFFSKDGFTLQLTESEALNKGIKAADYISIKAKILLMNQGVMEKLEDLGENEPLDFFFPEERVLKDGLDKRIIISTNKDDGKDCISTTRDPRVLVVTTHNGSRGSGRTVMPRRTQRISYAAHTKCTFGLFSGNINAAGHSRDFFGAGIYPASGTLDLVNTNNDGNYCSLFITSTACLAEAIARFE